MTFSTWDHANLVKFAEQANNKMVQQNDRIEQLQCDLKDALESYRELLRKGSSALPVND